MLFSYLKDCILYYPRKVVSKTLWSIEKDLSKNLNTQCVQKGKLQVLLINADKNDQDIFAIIELLQSFELDKLGMPFYRVKIEKYPNGNSKFEYQGNINISFHKSEKKCTVEYFKLPKTGTGMGTKAFIGLIGLCKQMGINYIQGQALKDKGYNGYYTWATLGCDFDQDKFEYTEKYTSLLNIVKKSHDVEIRGVKSLPELIALGQKGKAFWKAHGFTFLFNYEIPFKEGLNTKQSKISALSSPTLC